MTWIHITSPVCASDPRHPSVVHALDGLAFMKRPKGNRTARAACGRRVRPLGALITNGETRTMVWPPYVEAAASLELTRCKACFAATGKPRPVGELGHVDWHAANPTRSAATAVRVHTSDTTPATQPA